MWFVKKYITVPDNLVNKLMIVFCPDLIKYLEVRFTLDVLRKYFTDRMSENFNGALIELRY